MDHELEKFLSIVEHGSFTAAAAASHVSQPALSSAIKSLETRFGEKLLNRGTKPIKLTEAGQAVYATASRIRLELSNLDDQLDDIRSGIAAKTAIGAIDSVAMRLFAGDIPASGFTVHVDNSARLTEAVRLDRIDAAFITEPSTLPKGDLKLRHLSNEKFALVTAPSQAKTARQRLAEGHIDAFITYNPESTTFQRITAAAEEHGLKLHTSFVSTSPELMRHLVRQGQGTALLPRALVTEDVKSGSLAELDGFPFERPIALIHRREKFFNRRLQKLVELMGAETPLA